MGAWIEILTFQNRSVLNGSLPSWERGLKSTYEEAVAYGTESLPSWERGLKYVVYKACLVAVSSLPSWERGLKL